MGKPNPNKDTTMITENDTGNTSKIAKIREQSQIMYRLIADLCPDNHDRSVALKALSDCEAHAIESIRLTDHNATPSRW